MNTFHSIRTVAEIQSLAAFASEIWHEYFPCLLIDAQIDYMVEKFQSESALTQQIADGYQYFITYCSNRPAGYFGICKKPDGSLFLSKLYVKKEFRGHGVATIQFHEIQRLAQNMNAPCIWLTVNKYNEQAIAVYHHFGMKVIRSEITDIGAGFVMDDFVFSISTETK